MVRLTAAAAAVALAAGLLTVTASQAHALSPSSNTNTTSALSSSANSLAVAADSLLGLVPPLLDVVLLKAIYNGGQQVFQPPSSSLASSSSSKSSAAAASTKTSTSSVKSSSSTSTLVRTSSSSSSSSTSPTTTTTSKPNTFGGANTGDQSYNAVRAARMAGATWLVPRGQAQSAFNSSSSLFAASALARTTALGVKATYTRDSKDAACFPAVGFKMPSEPPAALDGWWCDDSSEYAFMGFSYEVSACQSPQQMLAEFTDARNTFGSRYIRMYGTCDNAGFYDQVIDIAWQVGLGLHALIWFGFDGDNSYIPRRDTMITALTTNPRAPFVVRALMFGSEPLYDWALPIPQFSAEIVRARTLLANQSIDVTFSELAYGFQSRQADGSLDLLKLISPVDIHILPYFAQDASTGDQAWKNVMNDENWFIKNAPGKKHYFAQCGWPSTHYPGVEPNSPNAVSSVKEEQNYFALLESKCAQFKTMNGNGVGWFYHIYSDSQEPGYGFYDVSGKPKFSPFKPSLFC